MTKEVNDSLQRAAANIASETECPGNVARVLYEALVFREERLNGGRQALGEHPDGAPSAGITRH